MLKNLEDNVWNLLLRKIKADQCTPFLGAGACFGSIPMGGEIARLLAAESQYPLPNDDNLSAVSQYLAIEFDPVEAKRRFLDQFIEPTLKAPPKFDEDNEPHGVLAQLPVSVYMTTNYDGFMYRALEEADFRKPYRSECQWHEKTNSTSITLDDQFQANVATPLVFHLHGFSKPEYLVLTEDDYLKFLAHMARNPNLLPPQIIDKLEGSSLIFIGYSIADWNFRILFENLRATFKHKSVAVLLPPGETEKEQRAAMAYLDKYYRNALDLEIYWGTAREFCGELLERWNEFRKKQQ